MALKAHIDPVTSPDGQRRQPRRALQLETSGVLPSGVAANVTIHNISAAGLLLETEIPLAEGEVFAIDLPEAGRVNAAIVWVSEHLYGCAFSESLGEATLAAAQLRAATPQSSHADLSRASRAFQPVGESRSEPLGFKLNRLRREKGMTLAQVADALGVSKPTVWAWEKGKARPVPDRMEAIASVLGVETEELGQLASTHAGQTLVEDCRLRIATAFGAESHSIRIMIEI